MLYGLVSYDMLDDTLGIMSNSKNLLLRFAKLLLILGNTVIIKNFLCIYLEY